MSASRRLELRAGRVRKDLDRAGFRLAHRLAGHSLFDLDRLVDLARRLPAREIEYNVGDLPVGIDPSLTPGNGLSPEETLRRIATCRSWLVLKRVERDRDYGALMEECLREIQDAAGEKIAGMRREEGFIFVSSPRSVTPYHLDPEVNFLLQIRGAKTCRLFPRSAVTPEELEARFCGAHRNLEYRPALQRLARTFRMRAGDGLHIPVATPHWVANGDEVSVSFSITFRTAASERLGALCRMNGHLRALGLHPSPAGRSPARDRLKLMAFAGFRKLAHPLRSIRSGRADD